MTRVPSFVNGLPLACGLPRCTTDLLRALCVLIFIACSLQSTAQDKLLAEDSKALQSAYNKLGISLEKNKDSIISSKQFRKQLRSLNLATERYLHLPDSMLRSYNTLSTYRSIDSLLRNKVRSISKKSAQSFLQLNQFNNHISQIKSLESELSNIYKTDIRQLFSTSSGNRFFHHTGFSASYQGQAANGYNMNNAQLADGITINKIPLTVSYTFRQFNGEVVNSEHVFNAQFDKDAFIDSYKKKLQGKLRPEDLIPKDGLIETAVQSAEMSLKHELDQYKNIPGDVMKKASSLQNIVTSDIATVKDKILGSVSVASIADKERIIRELELQVKSGIISDTQRLTALRKQVSDEKAAVAVFNTIAEQKKKWEQNGLVKKVLDDENLRKLQFHELLNDPKSIRSLADQYLQPVGIEKWLMALNSLKGGRQAVTLDNLSMNNFLADGMSMEMQSGSKYLFLLMGKQRQFNSLYDDAMVNPLQPQGNLAMGIRLGKGELNGTHSHISIFSYSDRTAGAIEKSNLVLSLSNKLVSGPSTIAVEVSHSSMRFKNESKANDPESGEHRFFDAIAANVEYEANFEDIGLNITANGLMTGRDYLNPGNLFLTQGLKQLDFGGQKSFFKNQLQVRARNNWRLIEFAQANGSKWRQNMLLLDARWQLGNGQYLGLQYQPMRSVKLDNGAKYRMSVTDRLTASFNFNKRISSYSYSNLVNLSHNKTDHSGGIFNNYQIAASSVQLNSIQSLAFKKHVIYWNTIYSYVYNKSNTFYSNNLFNTDAGFTYAIANKLQASSGLNYYSVKGWHAVAGVRQTITASAGKKVQLSLFIDWRTKIKETQYYYHEPLRADCSVRYMF